MSADLRRAVFTTSRAADFLDLRALQTQTGQPVARFGDVVLKELLDNALDAAESAKVAPKIEVESRDGRVSVADNGVGIPPEVVERILDFSTLTTDKAAYRSPTRGQQGNALKTILGIPYALGAKAPVVIEACGVRHEITLATDPGGNVMVDHKLERSGRTTGTRITVPVEVAAERWVRAFVIFNPHAQIVYHGQSLGPSVGEKWRKPLPTDQTSPHWYDPAALQKLVFAHIAASRRGERDLPVGEFVRSFAGLASSAKAREIAASAGAERLCDFEGQPKRVDWLLHAMQERTRVPKPAALGRVPEEHYRAQLGGRRFWFKRTSMLVGAIPWVIEVALADGGGGRIDYGVNYSPVFSDPLAGSRYLGHDENIVQGGGGLLGESGHEYTAAVHVICPAPEFLDKGKTRVLLSDEINAAILPAFKSATKTLYTERKRRARDVRRQARLDEQFDRENRVTLREAVFEVMQEAADATSGDGTLRYSVRSLHYQVRPRIQEYTDSELDYTYFSQTLTPDYEQEFGKLQGLYYEPRGRLHEPHGGASVPLGTLQVEAYRPTEWTYRRILYVEKEGLWPTLQDAQLAERFDLAVIMGAGYAVEACRAFLQTVDPGEYRIFVLHDADIGGYNIAITLGEETRRMPDYSVNVTDLGLTVADAIALDLPREDFTRTRTIPTRLRERLDDTELEWFEGTPVGKKKFACERVELNALAGPDLIAYIERRLADEDATGKLVPPSSVIKSHAAEQHRAMARAAIEEQLRDTIDALVEALVKNTASDARINRGQVETLLDGNPPISWRGALEQQLREQLEDALEERADALTSNLIK